MMSVTHGIIHLILVSNPLHKSEADLELDEEE